MLHRSPFYAESGGQIADTGDRNKGMKTIRVTDVQKTDEGNVHIVDKLPQDACRGVAG
jgi:alanyl-tRNA synthetase